MGSTRNKVTGGHRSGVKWYKRKHWGRRERRKARGAEWLHVAMRLRMQTVWAVLHRAQANRKCCSSTTTSWKSYCVIVFSTQVNGRVCYCLLIKLSVLRVRFNTNWIAWSHDVAFLSQVPFTHLCEGSAASLYEAPMTIRDTLTTMERFKQKSRPLCALI